jgi:hypothetical protein
MVFFHFELEVAFLQFHLSGALRSCPVVCAGHQSQEASAFCTARRFCVGGAARGVLQASRAPPVHPPMLP